MAPAQTNAQQPSPAPADSADPKTKIAEGFGSLIKRAQEAKDSPQKAGAEAVEEAGKISRSAGALTREAADTAKALAVKASEILEQPAAADKSRAFSLRTEHGKLGLDICDQGRRVSCTIFATLGVIEFHFARRGAMVELSEQYAAWAAGKASGHSKKEGYSDRELIAGIKKFGICREDLMPYNERTVGNPSKEEWSSRSRLSAQPVEGFRSRVRQEPQGCIFVGVFAEVYFLGKLSLWVFRILSRHSSFSCASAANCSHWFTADSTSSMILAARPLFISAAFAHASKSAMVKPSRFPFSIIWCVEVTESSGL